MRQRKDTAAEDPYYQGIMKLDAKMTIGELLERYPRAASAFIERKMICVGCPTEDYHTLEDAAGIYGCTVGDLTADIRKAIREDATR